MSTNDRLSVAALAYARAHRALQRATPKPWVIRTPETWARIEAKRLAMARAEGALCRAARARRRSSPDPVQDLMLAYRAEAAEQDRWLADITEALGLPASATQQERLDRARALAAQPCCVTFTVPEDWKEPLPD